MPRHADRQPHRLALLMGLVMLLVAGFAAQRSVHLCRAQNAIVAHTASCCDGAAVSDAAERSCCAPGTCHCAASHGAAVTKSTSRAVPTDPHARQPGPATRDHGCDSGCCVAIDVRFENGPLPKVMAFDGPMPMLAALPPCFATPRADVDAVRAAPATGPPRPDPQLALRRTTLLLL